MTEPASMGKKKKDPSDKKRSNDDVDEALEQTFPASDPPSYTTPQRPKKTEK